MAKLKVIFAPDPRLKQKCAPIEEITEEIRQLLDDMLEVMYEDDGVGLSANQVGITKRLMVMDLNYEPGQTPNPLKMVNPEILEFSDEKVLEREACMSCPGIAPEVERSVWVHIKYMDENGKTIEQKAEGIFAKCVQHEMDHLNGITLLDYIPSRLKREMALRKIRKYATFSQN